MASVLITGASKGIGRAIATEAAARGHRVVATARDPRTLEDLDLDLDLDLDVDQRLALDVTDPESIAAAVAAAGEIDTLVSNAGVIFYAAVEATPPEELARLFDRNTLGALRVAQAVMPGMRERGHGRLLFMSSVVGRLVLPPNAAYASTKWALEALVEALAVETAPLGLETALLEPGAVSSGALDDVDWFRLPGDPYAHLGTGGIDGRTFVTPEEVAAAVVDAVETEHLPLRIPVGAPAKALLAARHDAPDDVPFVP
jgi:NAD(P)-dependent dehydrogenase (short-subunit alcohol dehydrogenase family)